MCGLLRVGDEILSINGHELRALSHSDVIELLKVSVQKKGQGNMGFKINLTRMLPDPSKTSHIMTIEC